MCRSPSFAISNLSSDEVLKVIVIGLYRSASAKYWKPFPRMVPFYRGDLTSSSILSVWVAPLSAVLKAIRILGKGRERIVSVFLTSYKPVDSPVTAYFVQGSGLYF